MASGLPHRSGIQGLAHAREVFPNERRGKGRVENDDGHVPLAAQPLGDLVGDVLPAAESVHDESAPQEPRACERIHVVAARRGENGETPIP